MKQNDEKALRRGSGARAARVAFPSPLVPFFFFARTHNAPRRACLDMSFEGRGNARERECVCACVCAVCVCLGRGALLWRVARAGWDCAKHGNRGWCFISLPSPLLSLVARRRRGRNQAVRIHAHLHQLGPQGLHLALLL